MREPDSRLRLIEGRHNPLVKELRTAFAHGDAAPDGNVAFEGWKILEEAIRSGVRLRAVFFSDADQQRAHKLLDQIGHQVETILLPTKLFDATVSTDNPQGVAALGKWQTYSLADILKRASTTPLLALAGVRDPGNLGTILRSAEAFGAGGILLGENTVSISNPKVVRASAGSVFRVPTTRVKLAEILPQLGSGGIRTLATSSHRGTRLDLATLTIPNAIFIGSEGAGLPADLLRQMDETIAIPHVGAVESLNAAVAASVVLYEAARQKRTASQSVP